jgi:hypothetical protein
MTNLNRFSFLLILVIVSLVVLVFIFSKFVIPPLIESAYRGESLPILKSFVSGKLIHPVGYYLTKWNNLAWSILLILLLVDLIFLVMIFPGSQGFVDARVMTFDKNVPSPDPLLTLRRYRIWVVYAVIILITGGSLFDIITGTEHWPFSPYPMYSGVHLDRFFDSYRLYGVREEEGLHDISLWEIPYIQPFDFSRLDIALRAMSNSPKRQRFLGEALRDILVRYTALRRLGRHNGPPLRGIRLYLLHWKLDAWARNVDKPDRKELIFEIMDSVKNEK